MKKSTLKQMIFRRTLIFSVLVTIVVAFFANWYFSYSEKKYVNETHLMRLKTYGSSIKSDLILGDMWSVRKILENAIETDQFKHIRVLKGSEELLSLPYIPEAVANDEYKNKYISIPLKSFNGKRIWQFQGVPKDDDGVIGLYKKINIAIVMLVFLILLFIGFNRVNRVLNVEFQLIENAAKNLKDGDTSKELRMSTIEGEQIVSAINKSAKELNVIKEQEKELESQIVRYDISKQIAHDIRSPLEALKSVSESINDLDYTVKTIISTSIKRISTIANGLLSKNPPTRSERETINLKILLENIVTDKWYERNVKIDYKYELDFKDAFVDASEPDLYRAISNLINNGLEAQKKGHEKLDLRLKRFQEFLELTITDYGSGISAEMIEKVLIGGSTTKKNGNGLGLSFAKNLTEELGGKFFIESKLNEGTTIKIKLLAVKTPLWFTDTIKITKECESIICVDDDPSFLELHKEKLRPLNRSIITYNGKSFLESVLCEKSQYIFDYDLGESYTGLDLITNANLQKNSILVTSMYQDTKIQKIAKANNIKILPKQIYNKSIVRIRREKLIESVSSFVLIDDDPLIHMAWKMEAKNKNIKLYTFESVDCFIKQADMFAKSSIIYIDSNLKNGLRGEEEAKSIFELGFEKIYLATGYSKEEIKLQTWIKDVVSKRPNFAL